VAAPSNRNRHTASHHCDTLQAQIETTVLIHNRWVAFDAAAVATASADIYLHGNVHASGGPPIEHARLRPDSNFVVVAAAAIRLL